MAKISPAVPGKPTCVLALQGGGALGAYHIGAYQALAEHGFEPDWFSGISIGAINAAVLAGTPTQASFYDTSPMLETLRRLVDFDLINAGPARLTLGATDVQTGKAVFFDSANKEEPIGPAHVLA